MSINDEEWTSLGEVSYRKWKLYDIKWEKEVYNPYIDNNENNEIKNDINIDINDIDLSHYIIAGCSLGGPIALLRSPKMLIEINLNNNLRPNLMIFSSSGKLLVDIEWKYNTNIVSMGWTEDELLIVCLQDGNILCYDIRGLLIKTFKVGGTEGISIIGQMEVWNNGLAVLTEDMRVFVIEDLKNNSHKNNIDNDNNNNTIDNLNNIRNELNLSLSLKSMIGNDNNYNHDSFEPNIYELKTGLSLIAPSSMLTTDTSKNKSGLFNFSSSNTSSVKIDNNNIRDISRQALCMAVLPSNPKTNKLEILLSTTDKSIIVVGKDGIKDQKVQQRFDSPIVKMSIAPNGRFIACFSTEGILTVMGTEFETKVLDFDTKTRRIPSQMLWCGDDSVLLTWKQLGIVMVGPFGHSVQFPYNELPYIIGEPDCARIFTSISCEIIQRVPTSIDSIKRIGSTDPAAMLFDASEAFEDGDPKADENIQSIQENLLLKQALSSCLEAAVTEFDINSQQSLLKAVSYGKAFSSDFDSQSFVMICRKLRVLNQIRDKDIGLPLTWKQFNWMSPESLISKIVKRKHHYLALRICEYLCLSKDYVLIQWAIDKIKSSTITSTYELKNIILKKLKPIPTISYAEISKTADQIGKHDLAILLLEEERNITNQISLLLSFQQNELALKKACESKDSDLIYMSLLHTNRSLKELNNKNYSYKKNILKDDKLISSSSSLTTTNLSLYINSDHLNDNELFYSQVSRFIEAQNLLKIYYSSLITEDNRTNIHNFCVYTNDLLGAAFSAVKQSYLQKTHQNRISKLREAIPLLNSKEYSFYKKMTEEQIQLLDDQKALELKTHRNIFVDLSLSETLFNLLILGRGEKIEREKMNQEALELKKKYKVPDKRFWHIKIKALSSSKQWDLLRQFAESKRSPIGYKPFAVACIKYGQSNTETEYYIDRISKFEDKFDLFMQIGSYQKAAEMAANMKDVQRLIEVKNSTINHMIHRKIDHFLEKIGK